MAAKVIESWKIVKEIDNYEEVAGELLFRRIFEIAPQVHGMFRFTRDFEPGSEELYQSERFLQHSTGVIKTVDTAVSMLGPDLDPLIDILHDLGKKHAQYGALPAHYAVVGRALIDTLSGAIGEEKFTNEVKVAWARIYDILSSTMIEGAEEAYW
eukprot:CAMPEP_0194046528 /NCGR_PEP_ID=MMETSP0009_2-20130614/21494_1 /TAXON_ID=210454 /ORGANISM="Grammatophora oceanica, Strain CCMP 410" /LENGTH=154 /DNA_ID=CAMNT_0038691855 /DNA_START=117 /DNA_END=578 /DNA_ORIENTATION=+